MRRYKHITFGKGITHSLTDFKKDFAPHLVGLGDDDVEAAHKVATKGNEELTARQTKKLINSIDDIGELARFDADQRKTVQRALAKRREVLGGGLSDDAE